jgi:hypothetical protein
MLKGLAVAAVFMALASSFEGCNLDGLLGDLGFYPDDMDGVYVGSMRYAGTGETSSLDMEVLARDVALVEGLDGAERAFAGDFIYDSDEGEFEATLVFDEFENPAPDKSTEGNVPDTMTMGGQFEADSLVITGDFTILYADGSSAAGTWMCEQLTGPS